MANFLQPELTIEQIKGIATAQPTLAERRRRTIRMFVEGYQDVKYSDDQKKYLGDNNDKDWPDSLSNICDLTIQTFLDRLAIVEDGAGLKPAGDLNTSRPFADAAARWWQTNDLNSLQNDLHEYVLRDGEAALIVEYYGGSPRISVEQAYDGETGVRFYESELNSEITLWAAKFWQTDEYDENGEVIRTWSRMSIYLPDALYRYKAPIEKGTSQYVYELLTEDEVFNETGGQETRNPQPILIGSLPVVRFQNKPEKSEVLQVMRNQRLINKALGDIDVSAHYHAAPLITADSGLKEDTIVGPGRAINAPGAKRIEPPDLEKMWLGTYLKHIDVVSLLKRWPPWLLNPREFSVPSGTALATLERPFVSQIHKKQNSLDKPWTRVFDLGRLWHNEMSSEPEISLKATLSIEWQPANIEDVTDERAKQVDTALKAGLPYPLIWEQIYGMTREQIANAAGLRSMSLAFKEQVASIIETLVRAGVFPENAAGFLGLSDDETMELIEFNEPATTSRATNSNGNARPDTVDVP